MYCEKSTLFIIHVGADEINRLKFLAMSQYNQLNTNLRFACLICYSTS